MANLYRPSAHLYDLDPREITRDDIAFYRSRAKALGGPVLELGCGTGRVSIPLAEDGNEIWALDLSDEMLAQLQDKLKHLSPAAVQRLHMVHGSMSGFDLGRKFDLSRKCSYQHHIVQAGAGEIGATHAPRIRARPRQAARVIQLSALRSSADIMVSRPGEIRGRSMGTDPFIIDA